MNKDGKSNAKVILQKLRYIELSFEIMYFDVAFLAITFSFEIGY